MLRYVHRAGVGVIAWRQASGGTAVGTIAPRDNHRRVVSRGRVARSVQGYGVSGSASATGSLAAITLTAPTGSASATGGGVGNASGELAGIHLSAAESATVVSTSTYAGEIDLTPRKWYVKRKKKILIFNNAQEADAFIAAEELAEQAIQEAQKTSRRARKRLRDKIITVEPIQTVDVDQLSQAVERFSIPVDIPYLLAQQDFDRVMQTLALAMEMQDEEDVELLLLA